MTNKPRIRLRRVYDEPTGEDGTRVLVDRVWPPGAEQGQGPHRPVVQAGRPIHRATQWYAHDPGRFSEFTRRYRAELKDPERAEALTRLRRLARDHTVTLVTATKAIEISQAAVLADLIRR